MTFVVELWLIHLKMSKTTITAPLNKAPNVLRRWSTLVSSKPENYSKCINGVCLADLTYSRWYIWISDISGNLTVYEKKERKYLFVDLCWRIHQLSPYGHKMTFSKLKNLSFITIFSSIFLIRLLTNSKTPKIQRFWQFKTLKSTSEDTFAKWLNISQIIL